MDEPLPESFPLAPGSIYLDKYKVERVIGRGGMGVVVAARHIALNKLFAIKLMAVSHGSVNTAKALLQTSSLGESLLGVALSGFIPIACAAWRISVADSCSCWRSRS